MNQFNNLIISKMGNCMKEQQITNKKSESSSQVKYYTQILSLLKINLLKMQEKFHVLQKDVVLFIIAQFQRYYFTNSQLNEFLSFLQKYLECCRLYKTIKDENSQHFQTLQENIKELAERSLRNFSEAHFNHLEAIKISQTLFHSSKTQKCLDMNILSFDLKNMREIQLLSNIVKECCEQDLNAFYFLSVYLSQCCKKMGSSNKYKVIEIQNQLNQVLKKLRKLHPPNDKKPTQNTEFQVDFNKLESQLVVQLKDVQPEERNKKLQQQILQIAKIAKQNLQNFAYFTKKFCYKNNGIGYKAGLKVQKKENKSSIDRVKQKLLSKNFVKYEIPLDQTNLNAFLEEENKQYNKKMIQLFRSANQNIPFTVSDMLRGKCMFQEISDIKEAALQIIEFIKHNNYEFQYDNRLGDKTTDLVLKIKINKIITEFQLAYKFNAVQNEYNHKIYELARSRFFSVLSTLFIFNQKSAYFLGVIINRIKKLEETKEQVRIKLTEGQKLQQVSKIRQRFENFLKVNNIKYTTEIQDVDIVKKIQAIKIKIKNIHEAKQKGSEKRYIQIYLSAVFWNSHVKNEKTVRCLQQVKRLLQKDFSQHPKFIQKIDSYFAQASIKLGDYSQALNLYLKNLTYEKAQKGELSMQYAQILRNIGLAYKGLGRYKEALQLYQKCLKIQQALKGQNCYKSALTLNNIGVVYKKLGQFQEALKYYKRCLSIQIAQKGEQHLVCATTYNNIGLIYKQQENYTEALKYFEKCLKIQQANKGYQFIDSASTLNNIGMVYKNLENYDQAIKYYQKCLKIQQNILGEEHKDCASTYNNLGLVYKSQGKFNQALKYYEKCLNIEKKVLGANHIDCASSLFNIGKVYKQINNYQKSLQYFKQSLEVQKKNLGQDNIQCASTLKEIAQVFQLMGQNKEAQIYYQKAQTIQKNNQ